MALTTLLKKKQHEEPDAPDPLAGTDAATEAAPTAQWPSPAKPSAVLVPAYVRENRALAVTKRQVYFGALAVLLLIAAAVAGAFLLNISSQSALDTAETEQSAAQDKVDALSPIADYYDGLEARRDATVALLANDLSHADLFRHVQGALPANTTLDSYATEFGTPCLGPDPFETPTAIGCIRIGGTTDSRFKVSALLTDLARGKDADLVEGAWVTNIEAAEGAVTFGLNVNFTPAALSHKYAPAEKAEAAEEPAVDTEPQPAPDGDQPEFVEDVSDGDGAPEYVEYDRDEDTP